MIRKKINNYSKTAMYVFAVIGLIGVNGIGLCYLINPNEPIGHIFYITFFPFLMGVAGFVLSLIIFNLSKSFLQSH